MSRARATTLLLISSFAAVSALTVGCATSADPTGDPTDQTNTATSSSPCKSADGTVLLCADFDEPPSLGLAPTQMGGGSVEASPDNSVSKPNSLHVKTVSGAYSAAAYVINESQIQAGSISVDIDMFIVSTATSGADGDTSSSLFRVDLGAATAEDQESIGAFFIHYDLASRNLQLAAVNGWGPVGSNTLGAAPEGWFHLNVLVSPGVGGGAYAQATIGDSSATVSLEGEAATTFFYSFEAGLNVPAADNYEAYLDNVVVRKATTAAASGAATSQ